MMSENRQIITDQIAAIEPMDEIERDCKQQCLEWVEQDKYIYRLQKPDVPKKHLVSYFVVVDSSTKRILLVEHRKAGLWLPAGGHVDPKEDPRVTAVRECEEELGIKANLINNQKPFFITATQTNASQGSHTDVSLWYLMELSEQIELKWDEREFFSIKWWQINEILTAPAEQFDPQLSRFIRKLRHTWHETF